MNVLDILSGQWTLLLAFTVIFISAFLTGEIVCRIKQEKALKWGEKLDKGRKTHIKLIYNNIKKSYGIFRVILIIFAINLIGGALLWSSIGGTLIIFPFLHYIIVGFLVSLTLKTYPERMNWLTIPNLFFEVAAFMFAAIGGIKIGLSIFTRGDIYLAIREWSMLFIVIVIPLQLIAAIFEGFLFYKIHIIEKHPWPHGISEEDNE